MFLEQMTWPQVDALDRDRTLVVGCIAATEQHSRHLPIATDTIIGTAILQRLNALMNDRLLILPTLWLGCSHHHLDFAGTLSTRWEHMIDTIGDLVDSIVRHRFRRILIMNSHGGNQAVLGVAVQQLAHAHPQATIVGATYWSVAGKELGALRETPPGGLGHACELETSIVLAVAPDLVKMQQAEPDGHQPESVFTQHEMLVPPKVTLPRPFAKFTDHGGFGDPTIATAQKGEQFLDVIAGRMHDLCEDILADRV